MAAQSERELLRMAKNLTEEVAERFNLSVEDYLSRLPSVSLRPFGVDNNNNSTVSGDSGVEISRGVAWTLVAPLILLLVLVVAGVALRCLWRLKDRRCNTTETNSETGESGRDVNTGEIELQELHGEFLRSLPGPAPRGPAAADRSPGFQSDPCSLHHHREDETHLCPQQQRFSSHKGEGDRGPRGIQLLTQDDPSKEVLAVGAEKMNLMTAHGGSHKVASLENLMRVKTVGSLHQELFCSVCQHYVAQLYHNNPQRLVVNPHRYPAHQCAGYGLNHLNRQDMQHCKHCVPLKLSPGVHHISQSHDNSLHRVHISREIHLPRHVSKSLDDHLHLVPRYQPPHPAKAGLRAQDPSLEESVLQYQDIDLPHLSESPELIKSSGHTRSPHHGVENPLFNEDPDHVGPVVPCSHGEGPAGLRQQRTKEDDKVNRRHERTRVINSTSMLSTCDDGESDPKKLGQGHRTRRLSSNRKTLVEGPDVSSIKMPSSTSQAWRASCRLLPDTLTSSDTPSCNTNSCNTNSYTNTTGDSDDREETLSLPSSISRFHASRMQFPPLMPDAVYPLTSTKGPCSSPSWAGQQSRGECQASSTGGYLLETLDHFSDNTSMQPNVGSSVTSGAVSDVRESQTVSSSTSDTWGTPVGVRPPPSPSSAQQGCVHKDMSNNADDGHITRRNTETVHNEKTANNTYEAGVENSAQHYTCRPLRDQNHGNFPDKSNLSDPHTRPNQRKREPVSPDFPKSASELHHARTCREVKRKERAKKQGFFLIPGQGPRQDSGTHGHQRHEAVNDVRENAAKSHSRKVFSPTTRQRINRPQVYKRNEVSVVEEQPEQTILKTQTPEPQNPLSGVEVHADRDKQSHSEIMNVTGGHRKFTEPELHPSKLYSCKLADAQTELAFTPDKPNQLNKMQSSSESESKHRSEITQKTGSENEAFTATSPVQELVTLKASSMSASFPSVNVNQRPTSNITTTLHPLSLTLDNRTVKASRVKLKRVKSHEDYTYIHTGGSYFDDLQQSQHRKDFFMSIHRSGLAKDSLFNNLQRTPLPCRVGQQNTIHLTDQRRTPSGGGQGRQQNGLLNARTDSQVMAEIISSFPQSAVNTGQASRHNPNDNDQLGTLYQDVTIPTAFADELFGFWSLSPELDDDISPSQPRTPLMTPLKDEARKAHRKFIWGNSSSPSGSTSTSSFAPGWHTSEEMAVGVRRGNLSQQSPADNFGDYMEMNKVSGHHLDNDSLQMSVSDFTSTENVPPTPTWNTLPISAGIVSANDLSNFEDYKGPPLNNLNMSHLYVISGHPEADDVNNNATPIVRNTGDLGKRVTTSSVPNTSDVLLNQDSASSAPAVVFSGKKVWL